MTKLEICFVISDASLKFSIVTEEHLKALWAIIWDEF